MTLALLLEIPLQIRSKLMGTDRILATIEEVKENMPSTMKG